MHNHRLDILMAVFNGGDYVAKQLDSIFEQTYQNWRLLVRDDGSSDGTVILLNQFINVHPDKIKLISTDNPNLGAFRNFSELISHSKADYIMFCDQDDVWLPRKIEISFQRMEELESSFGKDTPLLVHTDLKVADNNLKVVADSLWHYQNCDPVQGAKLCRLLLQNVATGCTIMINKSLRDMALPIPDEAIMHDWWLALTAATFGKIACIAEPTVLYRQHNSNETGARSWNTGHIFRQLADLQNTRNGMRRTQAQAAAFLQSFAGVLHAADSEMIAAYAGLHEQGFLQKRYNLIKFGFAYTGLLRNLGLSILV